MARTHDEYKKLLKECRDGSIKDPAEFSKLINLLMLEVILDLREVLRDIRNKLNME